MEKEMISTFANTANILVCIFALCSILFIIWRAFGAFKLSPKRQHNDLHDDDELLDKLAQAESSEIKAGIFVSLMVSGYILIHKMINAGSKYDDNKQRTRFKKFLTPTTIKKLNTMGEKTR